MSLTRPHPLWTTCCSNPHEVNKASIEAKKLGWQYRSDYLTTLWFSQNKDGLKISGDHEPASDPFIWPQTRAKQIFWFLIDNNTSSSKFLPKRIWATKCQPIFPDTIITRLMGTQIFEWIITSQTNQNKKIINELDKKSQTKSTIIDQFASLEGQRKSVICVKNFTM